MTTLAGNVVLITGVGGFGREMTCPFLAEASAPWPIPLILSRQAAGKKQHDDRR